MNILLIPSTMLPFPPVKGGAVQNLIQSYVEYNENTCNHTLSVLSTYHKDAVLASESWKHCNVNFIKLPTFLFRMRDSNNRVFSRVGFKLIHFLYLSRIVSLVKNKYKYYDMIILENTPQFALKISSVFKKKLLIHIYNDYLNLKTPKIEQILHCCSDVVTVSNYISSCVYKTKIVDRERIHTLYNGVNLEEFGTEKNKSERNKIREKLCIPSDAFVFIFVARLVPEKGIKELIQAFNTIQNDNTHLVVVGNKLYSGDITDPFLLELKKLAQTNQKRIHFTGYVDYDKLPDYYSMADVGVLPSLYEEPFALAAIEYMASHLAVILSDAGGFPEMAENDSAIIVKRGEKFVSDLADEMTKLVNDIERYKYYSDRGYNRSRQFSSQIYCEKLDSIISSNK